MKDLALVKLRIFRFTIWYGNLKSKILIGKENNTHDLWALIARFAMQGL
jgi:hypothetical protein